MIRLKACNHCRGDLARENGFGDYYEYKCIQCGRVAECGGQEIEAPVMERPVTYRVGTSTVRQKAGHA